MNKEINKVIVSKNKARSVQMFDFDLSKMEQDIEDLNSKFGLILEHLSKQTEIYTVQTQALVDIKNIMVQMAQWKASDVADKMRLANSSKRRLENTQGFIKLVSEMETTNSMDASRVASRCSVSRVTALTIMQYLAHKFSEDYKFIGSHGNEASRIMRKQLLKNRKA